MNVALTRSPSRRLPAGLVALAALLTAAAPAGAEVELRVDASRRAGSLHRLHGVNNGPLNFGETIDLSDYYRQLAVPLVRLHDSEWPCGNVVDLHAIFPELRADANRPGSYRFGRTDEYIRAIVKTGAKIVYRLGESIETTRKKYHVAPPADYAQWTAACVGIIRHYNEGWAGGFRYGIRYWEIWNEPENRPSMWTGSDEDYYRLYVTAAKAIKGRFPGLKVGGPSLGATGRLVGGRLEPTGFLKGFLAHCRKHAAPLDFFSWHTYCDDPQLYVRKARAIRALLDQRGFAKAEIHLNEWNYLPDNDWKPMLSRRGLVRQRWFERIGGPGGAAFLACTLIGLQDAPVDAANYYSGETNCFGLFNRYGAPRKTFYAMKAFRALLETPLRVAAWPAPSGERAVCAGVNGRGTELTVLASNFRDKDKKWSLRVEKLPWPGETRWEILRVDARCNLQRTGSGAARPGTLSLAGTWEAPCVLLIRLGPKTVR